MAIREIHAIKTPDGHIYNLDDGRGRWLMSFSGFGMPAVVYKTERGYKQQGTSVIERDIGERTITLSYDIEGFSRECYWSARAKLLDILSWSLYEDLWLQRYDERGSLREIQARYNAGATFPALDPGSRNGTHSIADTLTLLCSDPFWYGDEHTIVGVAEIEEELAFPMAVPFWFGADFLSANQTITYNDYALWRTYPTITAVGPATGIYWKNATTSAFISYSFSLPEGVTFTIELGETGAVVSADNGVNYSGYLNSASSPTLCWIGSPKDVDDGINQIQMSLSGATASSELVFTYRDRYIGI